MTIAACSIVTSPPPTQPPTADSNNSMDKNIDKSQEQHKKQDIEEMSSEIVNPTHSRGRNKASESSESSEDSESSGLGGSQKDHTLNTDDESEALEQMNEEENKNIIHYLGKINEESEKKNISKELLPQCDSSNNGDEESGNTIIDEYINKEDEGEDATQETQILCDEYDEIFEEKEVYNFSNESDRQSNDKNEIKNDINEDTSVNENYSINDEKRNKLKNNYNNDNSNNDNEEEISNDENIDPDNNNIHQNENISNQTNEVIEDEEEINNRSQQNSSIEYSTNELPRYSNERLMSDNYGTTSLKSQQPPPEGTYINGVWIPNSRLSHLQQMTFNGLQFQPIPGFPQYLVPPPVPMMQQMVTQVSSQNINSQSLPTMANENSQNVQNPLSTIPSLQAFIMPQHLYPYFVDNRFSDFRNIIATGPTTINAPIPSEEGYDLFLHLQEGESISLCVGSPDMSKLTGPISMRWVARPGVIPTALPLIVPPGHIVQQLIDERGILRHMILSPDSQIYHNDNKEKNNNISNITSNNSNNNNIILSCNNTKQQNNSNNNNLNNNGMLRPRSHTTSLHYNKGDRNSPSDSGVRNINYHGKSNRMPSGVNNFSGNNNKNHSNTNLTTSNSRPQQQNNYHHTNAGHSSGGNQNTRYNNSHSKQQHIQYDNYQQNNNNHKNIVFEPYEIEYLHQILSSITSPQLIRCGSREAEISWNEIDLKNLSLHGNSTQSTLNIESSEFSYEVFLYEHSESGRLILNQTADRNQFKMKLLKLKPFTNYWVNMRVALIDRDIYGSPSKYLSFKTNPSVPDAPSSVRCISKSATWVQITWKYPNNNGSPITNFIVQFAKNKHYPFDKVWEGLSDTCKITDLEPSSSYRVRIIAVNSEGNSEPSLMIPVNTYAVHKNTTPTKPPNLPTIVEVGAEKVKIRWDENQNTNDSKGNFNNNKNTQHHSLLIYTLEMCEVNDKVISKLTTVPKHKYIFNTAIVDVLPDKEYQFRIAVSHPNGNCVRSDWVTVHTPSKDGNIERFSDVAPKGIVFMPTPINLKRLRTLDNDAIEIGWQYTGKEDVYYILEGCYSTDCINWKVIYNGKMNSYVNKDIKLSAFRVRAINCDEQSSAWSEVMFVVRKKNSIDKTFGNTNDSYSTSIGKPPCSTQPKFSNITSNSVKVSWKLVFFNSTKTDECNINENNSITPHYSINSFIASNTPVFYELQRVDTTPFIIYSGDVPEYTIEDLNAMEHLQVRVRAVAIDKMGVRNEGDWSCVSSCCTLSALPSKLLNLKIQTVSGTLGQNKCGVKLLIWSEPSEVNNYEIIEYKIYKIQEEINENSSIEKSNKRFEYFSSTVDTNLMLDNLIPNQRYIFAVSVLTNLGESEQSDSIEFITEQSVPFPPSFFDIIDITTNSFEVIWKEPKNKSNEITKYCLEIYNGNKCESMKAVRDGETIPMEIFYTEPDVNNKVITDLKSETPYFVKLYGISKTGKGVEVIKLVNTLPKPPLPPNLTVLLAASNFLKIKINAPNDINYFSLEQEVEGDFEEIYHGELRTIKAKNLDENTFYNFRIRAAFHQSHPYGDYSSTYTFKTSHTPPPQVKTSPTITEISQGVFNIEWPHVKMTGLQDNDDIICYRLQITNRFGKEKNGEPWKTIYEGTNNSFIYESDNGSLVYSKQIRIIVIKFVDGVEVQSLPSPTFNFKPILTHSIPDSPRKRNNNNNGKIDDSTSSTISTSPTKINKSMIGSSKRRWWIVNFCRRHARDIKMGVLCIIVSLAIIRPFINEPYFQLAFVAICIISAFFTRMTSGR